MQPNFNKPFVLAIAGAAILALSQPAAYADVNFFNSAAVSYTVNNSTNPNELPGLTVTGSFQQLTDAGDFYAFTSGDGAYLANNPTIAAVPVEGNSFSNTFSVSGDTAVYGTVNTLETGVFSLNFTNAGADSYSLDVTLNYLLNAVANGLFANSYLLLDYWDTGNNINGSDSSGAGTYMGHANDNESEPGAAELVYTLAPGASDSFMVQVAIYSTLDAASTAPVPLPAACWLFAGGLLSLFGCQKFRRPQA
jgi:hypothetical protein